MSRAFGISNEILNKYIVRFKDQCNMHRIKQLLYLLKVNGGIFRFRISMSSNPIHITLQKPKVSFGSTYLLKKYVNG